MQGRRFALGVGGSIVMSESKYPTRVWVDSFRLALLKNSKRMKKINFPSVALVPDNVGVFPRIEYLSMREHLAKLQTARKALETIRDTPIKYWMDKKGFADGEPTNCQEVASKALEEIE